MKVGEEYLYFQKKQRIIMFDSNEVFYDEIAIDNSLKYTKGKTVTYSRVSRDFFDKNAILISTSVSEKELLIHQTPKPKNQNPKPQTPIYFFKQHTDQISIKFNLK